MLCYGRSAVDPKAADRQFVEGGCGHWTANRGPSAAHNDAAPIEPADSDGYFLDGGEDEDAYGLVEIGFWNLIGFGEDLFKNFGRVAQAIVHLVLSKYRQGGCDAH